ncbi:Nicotinamide-nucleotide amidase [hydrothermal vent metagenome]|uniref:Nicotinamide-nucleotide amidase n=1 Tax=hydrothermal vent metagenome TaxID=652676 RepID=A0A3B0Z7U5_9ZZZZ
MTVELISLAERLGEKMRSEGSHLVTAESCTGGWIAQIITAVPGSSQWYDRGFITYTNDSKHELLGVRNETLREHGAVSEETVLQMAEGALLQSPAKYSVAVSGIAGPDGGTAAKPVGTVFLAWGVMQQTTRIERKLFHGNRDEIRQAAVVAALEGLISLVNMT